MKTSVQIDRQAVLEAKKAANVKAVAVLAQANVDLRAAVVGLENFPELTDVEVTELKGLHEMG